MLFYFYAKKNWQLPIFAFTIFGVKVLNFCVRDGNRCIHFAIVTNFLFIFFKNNSLKTKIMCFIKPFQRFLIKFSIYQYQSAQHVAMLPPLAYLPVSLSGILLLLRRGEFILELASRLDAFSGYPFHTQLLCTATGVTTDTPEVCPFRSSRTRNSSPQFSYAHDGQGPNCLTTF